MTDTTQGADVPASDNDLFNEAVATPTPTLAEFENPPPAMEPKPEPKAEARVEEPKPEPKPDEAAPVPPWRLREEAEARRKAERERDELRGWIAAQQQATQQQQPQQPKPDIFENPDDYVRRIVEERQRAYEERQQAEVNNRIFGISKDFAEAQYGKQTVDAAFNALAQAVNSGDPEADRSHKRIMASANPFSALVQWHRQAETMKTIGGDLEGYNKRYEEQLLSNPDFVRRVMEAQRGQAQATGNNVARPVRAQSSPSLGDIGTGGRDEQVSEPSDMELFNQATSARRR